MLNLRQHLAGKIALFSRLTKHVSFIHLKNGNFQLLYRSQCKTQKKLCFQLLCLLFIKQCNIFSTLSEITGGGCVRGINTAIIPLFFSQGGGSAITGEVLEQGRELGYLCVGDRISLSRTQFRQILWLSVCVPFGVEVFSI
jgi:hypothetical protein